MPDPQAPRSSAIAVAATFTAEPLLPGLRVALDKAGLPLEIRFAPYHQVFQELLSGTSLLATNSGGIGVVLVRMEDFVRDIPGRDNAPPLIEKITRELSDALSQYARRVEEPTVFSVLPPSPGAPTELLRDLEAAGSALTGCAKTLPGIHILSQGEIDLVSIGERYDRVRDELAHMPFTEEHYASLGLAIVRKVHALRVPSHKVLVLDCDNTLWRGVVGEDGVEGITVPSSLLSVQRFAVEQQARGTLVCLASKNAERDALEVFEKRTEMVLRPEHIVAHRINWDPKSSNLRSLAQELNLGLDSFVFLDDNPLECAQMRAELPQVVSLQLPPDEEIDAFLSHLWTFDKVAVTSEDLRRTDMYRESAARKVLESSTTNIAEFIASLGIAIDIAPPQEAEWPRVAQLTQRTNQFNFTTKRRSDAEIRAVQASGAAVLRVSVRDRFGDYGLVGLMIAEVQADTLAVDTLLLSCRVLGRGVEHSMLRRLGELAKERNASFVGLPYLPTPKNEPARAFAESVAAAFAAREDARVLYRIPVADACTITHRPGHDPEAVIKARDSEGSRSAAGPLPPAGATAKEDRSERYATLARDLVSGRALLDAARARSARHRTLPGQPQTAASETERKLLALWEELLGMDGLGVEDDYFALGGTSLLAAHMFAEVARRFGVKLRLTTILESPTVRALARYLEPRGVERSSVLIALKRGGDRNLFLVHDGDGETLLYLNLARRMPFDFSVFGIEPRRLPKVPLAHTRIEDMAAFYLEEMRKQQPHGPYFLGGLCAGGVIAYEMASQLERAGEVAELVALLDAAAPRTPKRTGRIAKQRLGRVAQLFGEAATAKSSFGGRVCFVAKAIFRKTANALAWEVASLGKRWSTRTRFRLLRILLARRLSWPSFLTELSVREIYDSAEERYAPPSVSGGGVHLVRARAGEGGDLPYRQVYSDDSLGWAALVPRLTVVDVDGGHSSMLQETFADSLASALIQAVSDDAHPGGKVALSREAGHE